MLIAGAVIGSASLCHAEAVPVNGIEAVVHDSVVTHGEVQTMALPAEQVLAREYRGQPQLYQKKLSDARNDTLQQLVERQLILHDFKASFDKPEQQAVLEKMINKDIDQEIAGEIRTRFGGNRMTFIQTLRAEGITLERHRQQLRDRMLVTWLRQKNISSEIIVSPHRVEAYYAAHRDEFKMQEEVKLRMIVLNCSGETGVVRTDKLAGEVLAKLNEGATFVEMATVYSEGSQRKQGGDLGWWELSRLNRGLADTAASLQAGQHSGVMSRSAGDDYWVCQYSNGVATVGRHYVADTVLKKENLEEERRFDSATAVTNLPPPTEFYLMLVEDKRPARFKTLLEVRQQIEKDLVTQEQKRLETQWIAKLKKKTFVRFF
jgi:peptidyl-prolyl cis-trans isomerase SurA